MSLDAKKQSRGSKAPELRTKTVDRFPPSQEWLMNLAKLPTLVASILILIQAFPDGRCSLTTKRAGKNLPPCASLSYVCCLNLASFVVRSSPDCHRRNDFQSPILKNKVYISRAVCSLIIIYRERKKIKET